MQLSDAFLDPINLVGKTIFVDFMVIKDSLDFNMLLWNDYVYAMIDVVSKIFCVIDFHHNTIIFTNNKLVFVDPPHYLTLEQVYILFVPNVLVDTNPP